MPNSLLAAQFTGAMVDQLRRCGADAGTDVMIYTDPDGRPELVDAAFAAATVLGARPFVVTVASTPAQRAQLPDAVSIAAQHAALVLDVSGRGMLHSTMQGAILASGSRILRAREPLEVLLRLPASDEVRARVRAAGRLVDEGSSHRFTTEAGTDITFDIGGRSATLQYGACDEPGRWDHWGTALVATAPRETAGTGTIVLAPGDISFLSATAGVAVTETVTIELVDGAISRIDGGVDAERIAAALDPDRFGPDACRISHIGWGLDHRAQWEALDRYGDQGGGGADVRSVAGGVVLAFGANADLGGANETQAHMDLALRNATVAVDEHLVVRDGRLADDEGGAP